MKLYINNTCPLVPDTLKVLKEIGVECPTINIDHEPEAQAELKQYARGNLSVPTLVLDNGKVYIEPSDDKLYQIFGVEKPRHHEGTGNTSTLPSFDIKELQTVFGVILILGIGLFTFMFAYEFGLEQQYSETKVLAFVGGTTALLVVSFLFILPPVRKLLSGITKLLAWKPLQAAFMLFYAAFIGFTLALVNQAKTPLPMIQTISLALLVVLVFFMLSRVSQKLWLRHAQKLRSWQRWLMLAMSFGFFALLLASMLKPELHSIVFMSLIPICVLALMVRILLISCDKGEGQILKHSRGLLFIYLAIFMWLALL